MPPSNKLLYRQFRLCITKAQGKAHTPCRAGACPPPLYWHKSFFTAGASPRPTIYSFITQIGRENKSDIPTASE